jgi:hypothetical protein
MAFYNNPQDTKAKLDALKKKKVEAGGAVELNKKEAGFGAFLSKGKGTIMDGLLPRLLALLTKSKKAVSDAVNPRLSAAGEYLKTPKAVPGAEKLYAYLASKGIKIPALEKAQMTPGTALKGTAAAGGGLGALGLLNEGYDRMTTPNLFKQSASADTLPELAKKLKENMLNPGSRDHHVNPLNVAAATAAAYGGYRGAKRLIDGPKKQEDKKEKQSSENMLNQESIYKLAFFNGFCKEAKNAGLSQKEAGELFKAAGPMDALAQGGPGPQGTPPGMPEESAEGQNEQMSEEDEARLIELLLAEIQKGGGLPQGVQAPSQGADQQIDPQELAALIQAFQADHGEEAGEASGAPPMPQGMA